MSGSSKTNEPSMDEILASIRKIIADDPSDEARADKSGGSTASAAERSAPAPSFGSALEASQSPAPSEPKPNTTLGADRLPGMRGSDIAAPVSGTSMPPPSSAPLRSGGSSSNAPFSRLGDALRGTRTPSNPMPSERFSELGRVQQTRSEPDGGPSRSRSSIENELDDILGEPISPDDPADRLPSGGDQAADDQWAVWRTQPGKADTSDIAKPAIPERGPSLDASRPSGFYPSSSPGPGPVGGSSSAPFQPKVPGEDQSRPTSGAFGAFVPKKDGGADTSADTASSPSAPKADVTAQSSPRFDVRPDTGPAPSSAKPAEPPPAKKPVVIAAMPAASSSKAADTPNEPATAAAASSTQAGGSGVPLPPRNTLFSKPFAMSSEPKPTASEAPQAQPEQPAAQAPAAAQPALPLAAAQVAASNAALNALVAAQPSQESPSGSTPVPTEQQQGGLQVSSGQPRTLEDMVADMVKPMLQKWLQDNMPRIIEKALRVEVSQQQANANRKPPQT